MFTPRKVQLSYSQLKCKSSVDRCFAQQNWVKYQEWEVRKNNEILNRQSLQMNLLNYRCKKLNIFQLR